MSVDESEDIVQWQYHFVKARDSTRALEVLWTLLCTPRRNLIPALGQLAMQEPWWGFTSRWYDYSV